MAARYFRGQPPPSSTFYSDDSDQEDDSLQPNVEQPALPRREIVKSTEQAAVKPRQRISARVVTPAPQNTEHKQSTKSRGSTAGFAPVHSSSFLNQSQQQDKLAHDRNHVTHFNDSFSSSSSSGSESEDVQSNHSLNANDTQSSSAVQYEEDVSPSNESELIRPTYIPQDLDAQEDEKRHRAERDERREEQRALRRRQDAKHLVQFVLKEEANRRDGQTPLDVLPDDEDKPEFYEADHALWKVRELLRIKRDRDELAAWERRTSVPLHSNSNSDSE